MVLLVRFALLLVAATAADSSARLQHSTQSSSIIVDPKYKMATATLQEVALKTTNVYELGMACDLCGARPVGSVGLNCSVDMWYKNLTNSGIFDKVWTEPVYVPTTWNRCRGNIEGFTDCEYARMLHPRNASLHILGAGGTIATPNNEPLTAEVLVVENFDDLAVGSAACNKAAGKIVVFTHPFTDYDVDVEYRASSDSHAAACGAVGVLFNSVGLGLQNPETGEGNDPSKIPSAAVSREDAKLLQRIQDIWGITPVVQMYLEGHSTPGAHVVNLLAEITGAVYPDKVVVVGGHLDSWEAPGETGATDDGTGTFAGWSAVKAIALSGLPRPKRTVRYVGWVDEERTGSGGKAYAKAHADEETILAYESDSGNWTPYAVGFCGNAEGSAVMQQIVDMLDGPIELLPSPAQDGCGADIAPLLALGVPGASLEDVALVNGTGFYFDFHHSVSDTFDVVLDNELAVQQTVGVMASVVYVVADMDEDLPSEAATQLFQSA